MKKFTKICLMLALVLVLVGGSICIVGGAAGGFEIVRNMNEDSIVFGKMGSVGNVVRNIWPGHWNDEWNDGIAEMKDNIQDMEEEMQDMEEEVRTEVQDNPDNVFEEIDDDDYSEDYDDFTDSEDARRQDDIKEEYAVTSFYEETQIELLQMQKLYLTIGGAAIYIKPSEDDMIYVEKQGRGKYKCYVSDSALYIEGNQSKAKLFDVNNEKVYLYLPEGIDWKKIDIIVGGGMLDANELSADQIVIQGGAGAVSIDNITCTRLSAEVGAGSMKLGYVQAADLELNVGVGYVNAAGNITDKIDIECGLGTVELALDGSQDDYNYNLECDAGTIRIGDQSYSAFSGDKHINNKAEAKCDLQCSMGSMSVSFTE